MLTRVDAERLLVRFFELRNQPSEGLAYLDFWASDADLLLGNEVVTKREVDPVQFARAHHDRVVSCLEELWAFPAQGTCEWVSGLDDGASEGVVWARFLTEGQNQPLWLAFGVRVVEARLELVWLTLAACVEAWSFGKGRAMALSDIPFLRTSAHSYRDWLDLAYRRRYQPGDQPLLFQEDARFSCQGSGACCKMKWEVTTERATQRLLDQLPWSEFAPEFEGLQLEPCDDDTLYVKKPDETCRFLDTQNRCRLHLFLGTPVFHTCIVYPYRFVETPDGVAVTTSHFCDSARKGIGLPLAAQSADIRTRLILSRPWTPPEQFLLTPDHPVTWDEFKQMESRLRRILNDDASPLHERLWMMTDVLAEPLKKPSEAHDFTPLTDAERMLAEIYLSFLFKGFSNVSPEFACLDGCKPMPGELRAHAQMTQWLDHLLFAKELSFHYDLLTAHATLVTLYVVVLELEKHQSQEALDAHWRILGTLSSHKGLLDLLKLFFQVAPFLRDEFTNINFVRMVLRMVAPQFAAHQAH